MHIKVVRAWAAVVTLGIFVLGSTDALVAKPAGTPTRGEMKSPALVQRLAKAMADAQLTSLAARSPAGAEQYVAVMLFPGVQLLLIAAQPTAPAYVESMLSSRDFASVYAALQQGVPESKFFVHDMGCDGLTGVAGGSADIIYLRGKDQRIIDGDHKAAEMSSADYNKLVGEMDRRYAELLAVLLEAAGGKNGSK